MIITKNKSINSITLIIVQRKLTKLKLLLLYYIIIKYINIYYTELTIYL